MAEITEDFSFAYLKEAFVATLLDLARNADDSDGDADAQDESSDPFAKYEFWRSFKEQVKILRDDMGSSKSVGGKNVGESQQSVNAAYEELLPLLDAMKMQSKENAQHFPSLAQETAIDPQNPFMRSEASAERSVAFDAFRARMVQNGMRDGKGAVWGRDMV